VVGNQTADIVEHARRVPEVAAGRVDRIGHGAGAGSKRLADRADIDLAFHGAGADHTVEPDQAEGASRTKIDFGADTRQRARVENGRHDAGEPAVGCGKPPRDKNIERPRSIHFVRRADEQFVVASGPLPLETFGIRKCLADEFFIAGGAEGCGDHTTVRIGDNVALIEGITGGRAIKQLLQGLARPRLHITVAHDQESRVRALQDMRIGLIDDANEIVPVFDGVRHCLPSVACDQDGQHDVDDGEHAETENGHGLCPRAPPDAGRDAIAERGSPHVRRDRSL